MGAPSRQVNLFEDDVLGAVMSGANNSRMVIATESKVLAVLKQSAAIITASGSKTDVEAYESTYKAMAASLSAHAAQGRRLQTAGSGFFFTYQLLTEVLSTAASMANVQIDTVTLTLAANTSSAAVAAVDILLVEGSASQPESIAGSTNFLADVVRVEAASSILAQRSSLLVEGILNGSVPVEEVMVTLQSTTGAEVVRLSREQAVNESSFLLLACGDPTASNYVVGGTGTSRCRYPSEQSVARPGNEAERDILMIIIIVVVVAAVIIVLTPLVYCKWCKPKPAEDKRISRRSMEIRKEKGVGKVELIETNSPKSHQLALQEYHGASKHDMTGRI